MRVAVTGATGRLGGAVLRALAGRPGTVALPWAREAFDLDAPDRVGDRVERDRPDVVVHCAAWTDVDGCARDPEAAERRNGRATGALARACAARGVGLLAVSTNEVFDGRRTDGRPYEPGDDTDPINPYGRSKRLGELAAIEAFAHAAAPLWIARTAWLFGPPGADFPRKILNAARAAAAEGRTLSLVADEVGSPTFAGDAALAIADLIADPASAGIHHVVNAGSASRAAWARRVLELAGVEVETADVSMDAWARASTPPRFGVLAPTRLPTLGTLRPWSEALTEDLAARAAAEPDVWRPA